MIEQGEIQKWSVLGTFNYDKDKNLLGTIFEISPSYGNMQETNSRSLWSTDILENISDTGQYMDGLHVVSNIGYGIAIFDHSSRLTPFGGIDFAEDSNNKYHIGTRVQLGTDLTFELIGTQEFNSEGSIYQKIQFDGTFNW